MLKTIRFFKIAGGPQSGWYADVLNHTLEENQMVSGSDLFLEAVDKLHGGRNEVNITVSDCNVTHDVLGEHPNQFIFIISDKPDYLFFVVTL